MLKPETFGMDLLY